ncbi:cytochrome P450 [Mycobacterium paraintracellulare]|uniref:cytochrome P450 n=2 Tax=Mycobacterium avium complex (MAC) TaxID=120793 RepID=UPI00192601FC|nr:cytochrome P450 [Mycobacterium paraintracellulare]BCP05423.1 cytochrome P450 [Mycobacterium paraintracellulare]
MELDLSSMMTDPALANNPWPVYAGLRDYAPAIAAPFSRSRSGTVVVLSRYEDIRQALSSPEMFEANGANEMGQQRPCIPLDVDPPNHAKYRKLLDPLFSPRAVRAMADETRAIAREILAEIVADGHTDFHKAFTVPFPCRVFLNVVGFPTEDLDKFLAWKDAFVHGEDVAQSDDLTVLRELWKKTATEVYAYFDVLLDRRITEPADDLATRLVQAEIEGVPLTRNEMLDILFLQMAAGLDTVTATLDCVITRLAKDAALQAAARSESDRMKQIVEELLRIESPVSLVLRYATEDMVMHDVKIAKGDMVLLMLGSANNDDREFEDPQTLNFDRNNTRHLAFGGGVHRCLGSHLARQELTIALEEIFAVLGPFRIPEGEEVNFVPGIRTAHSLPLEWKAPVTTS